jgi:IclR family transcriptional regulator, acetate operon repressor
VQMVKPLEVASRPTGSRLRGAPKSEGAIRTARLLTAFTHERNTLTAKELAAVAEIPLPSVYRYIATLREAALLVGDEQGGYHLSTTFVTLARAAQAAERLIEVADPLMRTLSRRTNESVALVRVVIGALTCVHRVDVTPADRPRCSSLVPGRPLSVERGASARVLLATMDAERRAEHVDAVRARDPELARRLVREVDLAASRRWATSAQEVDPDVWAAAAAIDDPGRGVAAVSVSLPLSQATEPARIRLLGEVRSCATSISRSLRAGILEATAVG